MKNLISYLRARPAILAALVSIAGTAGADAGLNLTSNQLVAIVTALNVLLGVSVHVSTGPKAAQHGDHEKP